MYYRDDKLKFHIFKTLSNLDNYVIRQLLLSFLMMIFIFLNYHTLITILIKTLW